MSSTTATRKRATRKADSMLPPMTPKLGIGLGIVATIVLFGVFGPMVLGDPNAIDDIGLTGPSAQHWLGTTQTGQDVFTQLAYACRGSLFIGLTVGVLTVLLSSFVGIVGAYMGGAVDEIFSLLSNVMLVIPGLPLMIVIASYVPNKSAFLIACVLALTSWAGPSRVLRGFTMSVRSRDYVLAARVAGEKPWRVLFVEIFPNLIPLLASQAMSAVIAAILGEAGLSYLGLGATDSMTWGTMLYYAQNGMSLLMGAWWWFAPPGLCIALFGAALALINFSVDEIINPKLKAATRAQIKQWKREEKAGKARSDQRHAAALGAATAKEAIA
ncbi:ABC transporter permease [Bifidobacterium lemurum]|uniref:ABC transporter permease n=1 Tax=Bifidobacterium lemurum TaxID=1603886 RepID=A0A261FUH0_9BIFI|nr:ABC transporter permease [Bifidobacterium lemurum]OZG62831.1 ABC transporter permease [Bifidobacterium lemurum]QOL35161.1 ABC transporter permease [Bifidobacterium lemurum]